MFERTRSYLCQLPRFYILLYVLCFFSVRFTMYILCCFACSAATPPNHYHTLAYTTIFSLCFMFFSFPPSTVLIRFFLTRFPFLLFDCLFLHRFQFYSSPVLCALAPLFHYQTFRALFLFTLSSLVHVR